MLHLLLFYASEGFCFTPINIEDRILLVNHQQVNSDMLVRLYVKYDSSKLNTEI